MRLYCTNPVAFGSTLTVIVKSSPLIVMFASIVVFLSGIGSIVNVFVVVFLLYLSVFYIHIDYVVFRSG